MSEDDDNFGSLMGPAMVAAATSVDSSGGILMAMASHALTSMTTESQWRASASELWLEVLVEENNERRRRYREAKNEFEAHRLILNWLRDEVSHVHELEDEVDDLKNRVADLEAVALGLLGQTQEVLRAHPEPEMRPYLRNALANTLRRPEEFSPTHVRRLNALLMRFGADHLDLLLAMRPYAMPGGRMTMESDWWADLRNGPRHLALMDLEAEKLFVTSYDRISKDGGPSVGTGGFSRLGLSLCEFVSAPGSAEMQADQGDGGDGEETP